MPMAEIMILLNFATSPDYPAGTTIEFLTHSHAIPVISCFHPRPYIPYLGFLLRQCRAVALALALSLRGNCVAAPGTSVALRAVRFQF
jgi:hypothetical protein